MFEEGPIELAQLNEFITCKLCYGYLIDAISITECLHHFCKSCIVKHFEEKKHCPVCGILIHQSHPLNYLSFDRTLQDIVYKVVPNLRTAEKLRREEFYSSIGEIPPSEDLGKELHEPNSSENSTHNSTVPDNSSNHDLDFHRKDEQVNVQLEPGSESLEPLSEKYLRLSSKATVTHLRKYVAQQVLRDISKFHEIDIFIKNTNDGTFLGRDHVLKFVRVVYWNDDNVGLSLNDRIGCNMDFNSITNPFADPVELNERRQQQQFHFRSESEKTISPSSHSTTTSNNNNNNTLNDNVNIPGTVTYNFDNFNVTRPNDNVVYHNLASTPGHYEDFETIDWVKDINRDRCRHREVHLHKKTCLETIRSYWDSCAGWVCVLLVGLATGIIACIIDVGSSWMSDLKEGVCLDAFWFNREQCCWSSSQADRVCDQWFTWSRLFVNKDPSAVNLDAYFVAFLFYLIFAVIFSGICVLLVRMFAPYACGSGLPEIKTILGGFIIRGYLGKWTLLIKSVGMILCVAAGLNLGKEGPMVHMASCVGNVITYLFPKYGQNEAKKREILSASAAAGVAVAFGAPIGGVLFSLEEASYYFPMKTLFRSFLCAMVSANTLRMLNPYGSDNMIMFYVDYKAQWHIMELFPFALLGFLGGIFGAVFIRANLFVCRLRKNTWIGKYPVREVLIVTALTAIVSFPHEYLRMNTSELIKLLVNQCSPSDDSSLCDYVINSNTTLKNVLGNYPSGPTLSNAIILLSVALFLKLILTVFTFGIKVPTGLFIPSLAAGSIMGRMLGVAIEQIIVHHASHPLIERMCKSSQPCINPGLYAMVGAAAALGGVTRMTISLVVVMLELTGGLNYIIPLMVASMVSKWTGDRLTEGSIYEGHIRLNDYPYLGDYDLDSTLVAADVMQPRDSQSPLFVLTQNGMTVKDIENLLQNSIVKGFPVVVSEQSFYLVGWVSRRELKWALDREKNYDASIVDNSPVYFSNYNSHMSTNYSSELTSINLQSIVDLSPTTVTDQTPMQTVLDFFRKLGLRQIIVTHNGCLLGIMTKKDILKYILQHNSHN